MGNAVECDVLIVGGGPAGSTAAALLARQGKHVVLLEKERFPRFHIGESLLPLNLPLFDLLGVADEVRRLGVYKPGAQVFSDEHRKTTVFRFGANPHLAVKHAYQVKRADFDQLLLDNSRRCGAIVEEAVRVTDIAFETGARAMVTAVAADGTVAYWRPRFVIDASGRDTLLATRFKTREPDKRNNTAALFGHFRDVQRREGNAEGMIAMHLFPQGWFWVIPLPDGITSVGVVGTQSFFKSRTGDLDAFFAQAVAATPSLAERMTMAQPVGPLVSAANFSYRSTRVTGDGYVLVGDAAAFIDPLFSSGVMLAMSSGALVVEAVAAQLDGKPEAAALMREYERKARRGLKAFAWLIYRINTPTLRDMLMQEFDLFDTRNGLIAILAGDFYAPRWFLSPLRRVQLAYAVLLLCAKLGFRLHSRDGRIGLRRVSGRLNSDIPAG
jgi:flavin-dependent dehydrogenase